MSCATWHAERRTKYGYSVSYGACDHEAGRVTYVCNECCELSVHTNGPTPQCMRQEGNLGVETFIAQHAENRHGLLYDTCGGCVFPCADERKASRAPVVERQSFSVCY